MAWIWALESYIVEEAAVSCPLIFMHTMTYVPPHKTNEVVILKSLNLYGFKFAFGFLRQDLSI